jgi:hypothetical protein
VEATKLAAKVTGASPGQRRTQCRQCVYASASSTPDGTHRRVRCKVMSETELDQVTPAKPDFLWLTSLRDPSMPRREIAIKTGN